MALPRLARIQPLPRLAQLSLAYTRLAARFTARDRIAAMLTSRLVLPRLAFATFLGVCFSIMLWVGHEYNTLNQDFRSGAGKKDMASYQTILLTQLRDRLRLQSIEPAAQMSDAQLGVGAQSRLSLSASRPALSLCRRPNA